MANATVKYHINPETGNPGVCSAKKKCRFGDITEDHYPTKEDALAAYETRMAKEPVPTVRKADISLTGKDIRENADELSFEDIEEFANRSPEAHAELDKIIDERAAETLEKFKRLDELNPYENSESSCSKATYKNLKRDFEAYKDTTAAMVEAHLASPHYKSAYIEASGEYAAIGNAVVGTSHDPNSREWLEARYDSIGGSDVGTIATMDFSDADKIMYWDRRALDSVENSKREMPSEEKIAEKMWSSFGSRSGALYRGTAWEDRSRDIYAKNNPHLKVYNTKDQYYNPDRPWQQVNFDGLTSDREDGKPTGLLEFKTSNDARKWENGVPLNYRAQVLYYLNATGLEKCTVVATINDGEQKTFDIYRDDPVAPTTQWKGGYDNTMESYINNRIGPWFDRLKSERTQAA